MIHIYIFLIIIYVIPSFLYNNNFSDYELQLISVNEIKPYVNEKIFNKIEDYNVIILDFNENYY